MIDQHSVNSSSYLTIVGLLNYNWDKNIMRPTFPRLLRLSQRYKLIDHCPVPLITTPKTLCECSFPEPIDHSKPLLGTKALSWKHVLVHSETNAKEWSRKVELMPTELISHVVAKKKLLDPSHPVMMSAVELDRDYQGKIVVFPDRQIYDVHESQMDEFVKQVCRPDHGDISLPHEPFKGKLILICGHMQRDGRCGAIAPILQEEFTENLRQRGLLYSKENETGVKVGIVSHIGGHVYAGNVIYFDEEGLTVWYGRCEAKHVDGIVKETIMDKNVIRELFRGRY